MMDQDSQSMSQCDDTSLPGCLLAAARLKLGLTIEDVASAICLRAATVDALEKNQFDGMPAPVFARGYLLTYARFVNVSSSAILAALSRLESPQLSEVDDSCETDDSVELPPSRHPEWFAKKPIAWIGSSLVVMVALFFMIHGFHFSTGHSDHIVANQHEQALPEDTPVTLSLQPVQKNVKSEPVKTVSTSAAPLPKDQPSEGSTSPASAAEQHHPVTMAQAPVSASIPLKPTYTVTPIKGHR